MTQSISEHFLELREFDYFHASDWLKVEVKIPQLKEKSNYLLTKVEIRDFD